MKKNCAFCMYFCCSIEYKDEYCTNNEISEVEEKKNLEECGEHCKYFMKEI